MTPSLDSIRAFLLDMDGTFYLGDRLIEGALHFIEVIQSRGKDFLFLTNNSSKDARQYAEKISGLGLPISEQKVLTSGEATALYLKDAYPGEKLYVIGTPALEQEFQRHGFRIEQQSPQVVVLGFDTALTYDKLWRLCDLVRQGLPYIATHPDINCPTQDGFMPDIGATIAFVAASTGRYPDEVIGKPDRRIVEAAARKLDLPVKSLAMIGDRLYTDIALGQTSGIATVLVLSGETSRQDLATSPYRPDYIFEHLGALANWLESNSSISPQRHEGHEVN